jgi:hypothetical protein
MSRETRQEREKRLAEALRRNLGRRKQARRSGADDGHDDGAPAANNSETGEKPAPDRD